MNRRQRRAAAKIKSDASNAQRGHSGGDVIAAGLRHHRAGRLADAEVCYRQVLTEHPDHADALHLLGVAAYQSRRYDLAIDLIQRAITKNRQEIGYRCNLGAALTDAGRFAEALAVYDEVLRIKPDYAEAHNNRANTLVRLQRHEEAIAGYERAVALDPNYVEPYANCGSLLYDLKRLGQAEHCYEQVLARNPDSVAVLNNFGNVLKEQGRLAEALALFARAMSLAPNSAEILNNEGTVLKALSRNEEAVDRYDRAIALNQNYATAHANRGAALYEMHRFQDALASYEHAIAIDPDYALPHWNEALLRLLMGDFERGWVKREWRWKCSGLRLRRHHFVQRSWLGQEAVENKTILLYDDEGFGDTIHFVRYVPLLAARGARVILEVAEPLKELISNVSGVSQCVAIGEAPPDFDMYCALGSLPLAFATDFDSIPSTVPYLRAPSSEQFWAAKLGSQDRPRIGLVWSGNPNHVNDYNRSMPLHVLSALFDFPATFVSLQKNVRPADQAALAQSCLLDVGPQLASFSDTAAVLSHLDLVISVDTSVAHLAGALGCPVWILLPFTPDWRWLLDRDDSPWYPTARLFRQGQDREWPSVVRRVREALNAFVSNLKDARTASNDLQVDPSLGP